jgi:hypothetical protein
MAAACARIGCTQRRGVRLGRCAEPPIAELELVLRYCILARLAYPEAHVYRRTSRMALRGTAAANALSQTMLP